MQSGSALYIALKIPAIATRSRTLANFVRSLAFQADSDPDGNLKLFDSCNWTVGKVRMVVHNPSPLYSVYLLRDNVQTLKFYETEAFARWSSRLRDPRAKAQIVRRLARASQGNFGDVRPVGDGISEMRIDIGPGYRVYYARRDEVVYILLCGGDKVSQTADIEQAKRMWKNIRRGK